MRGSLQTLREPAETAFILCCVVVLWQVAVKVLSLPAWLLPAPTDIWATFLNNVPLVSKHTFSTAVGAVGGLVAGAAGAIFLAIFMANSTIVERAAMPLLLIDQSIPKAAIAPLLVIWLGSGMAPRIVIGMIITFFPIAMTTLKGLTATDPRVNDLMHVLSGNRLQRLWKIQFPSALPYIFSGLKVAAPLAVIGAVIAEFLQSNSGLGYVVVMALSQSDTSMIFVAIAGMALLSVFIFGVVRGVESIVLRRRYSHLVEAEALE